MKLVKVNNNSNLVKDEETGAVLNNNVEDVEKAKEIKEKRIEKEEELVQLKNDVSELKEMMKQLLEKMNNDG
tara:strand:- start:9279 stop:9494 length:216 start_codon:yes stop_codon:yes gene_type:complete